MHCDILLNNLLICIINSNQFLQVYVAYIKMLNDLIAEFPFKEAAAYDKDQQCRLESAKRDAERQRVLETNNDAAELNKKQNKALSEVRNADTELGLNGAVRDLKNVQKEIKKHNARIV